MILAMTLLFISCEKELDFNYHDVESQLVIEGITTNMGTSVTLTHTTPMGDPINTRFITDASVRLTDLSSGDERILVANLNGEFCDNVPGIVGHNYKIDISYQGKNYSSLSSMKPASQIDDLQFQWIKMPYDYVAVLRISFCDFETKDDCYWIKLYRNDAPYMWILSDDRSAVNGMISEVVMTSRKKNDEEDDKKVLKDGDEVKVVLTPISRLMYDYLSSIQSDSNGVRMFSGDFCLGYYFASTNSTASIIFHPDNLSSLN